MIKEFTGQYRYLSNFFSCDVIWDDVTYPSVENAYQAAKCERPEDRIYFETCKAVEAKKKGKKVKLRAGWDNIKLLVMESLLRQKFSTEPLKKYLLATGTEEIQEGNWWGDVYWGVFMGVGENHLGKILMKIRGENVIHDERRNAL